MNETPTSSPTSAPSGMPVAPTTSPKSGNKFLTVGLPLILLALLAGGYFLGVPMMQLREQKALDAKHKLVNDKLVKVYESFKRDAFTKADADATATKIDVKVGLDAVKDARAALDDNAAAMTKFKAWPVLDWQTKYHAATQLDTSEEKYVKDARAFLADYDGLLAYTDKSADISAEAEKTFKDLETVSSNDTPEQIAAKVDASVAKIQPLLDQAKAMNVPAFIKDEHDADISSMNLIIADFKQMSAAIRKLDVPKITAAETDVTKVSNAADARTKTFITKLQTDSPVQKQIDGLRSLSDQIDHSYSSL